MTEQNTFGDRLAALTEAIAARPDARAEDHLTYAEFLLSGKRVLKTATEKAVSSTPSHLIGQKVLESKDDEYPVGVRARDEGGDIHVKVGPRTWDRHDKGGVTPQRGTNAWNAEHFNAVFIA